MELVLLKGFGAIGISFILQVRPGSGGIFRGGAEASDIYCIAQETAVFEKPEGGAGMVVNAVGKHGIKAPMKFRMEAVEVLKEQLHGVPKVELVGQQDLEVIFRAQFDAGNRSHAEAEEGGGLKAVQRTEFQDRLP